MTICQHDLKSTHRGPATHSPDEDRSSQSRYTALRFGCAASVKAALIRIHVESLTSFFFFFKSTFSNRRFFQTDIFQTDQTGIFKLQIFQTIISTNCNCFLQKSFNAKLIFTLYAPGFGETLTGIHKHHIKNRWSASPPQVML